MQKNLLPNLCNYKNRENYYEYAQKVFESHINTVISTTVDFSVLKGSILERIKLEQIKNKEIRLSENNLTKGNFLDNIFNLFSNTLLTQIKKSYAPLIVCTAIIVCSLIYFQVASYELIPKKISSLQQVASLSADGEKLTTDKEAESPDTIITSINGDVSSIMILESEDRKMTIIWYKEV